MKKEEYREEEWQETPDNNSGEEMLADGEDSQDEEAGYHPEADGPTLKEYIEETSKNDEQAQEGELSLRKVLGGDILYTRTIRQQIWVFVLILIFCVIHIANRYSCQNDQVEIARLTKNLQNSQYKALAISSELTEHCRESHVLEMLRANNDSTLHSADQPPYIIIVNSEER